MADWIRALRRVLDYAKDPNPEHWRTINGSKVHLDENGNYDGGAGGRFNGRHHYGPGWKDQKNSAVSAMKNLANGLKNASSCSIDMGPGVGNIKCYRIADRPDEILIDKGLGLERFTIKGGLQAFIEKMEAAGYKASPIVAHPFDFTPDPLPKGSGGQARQAQLQTRAMKRRGRPPGAC